MTCGTRFSAEAASRKGMTDMMRAQINRAMAEVIVRRSLHEIRKDPKRALRNLVDLGQEAAGGAGQKRFLGTVQQLLTREDSPYYTLIQNTVRFVDEEWLLTFGMNLGWDSLTRGAGQIRAEERRRGHSIPWSLTLHLEDAPGSLSGEDWHRIVREGTELGIYSYFLFPRDAASVRLSVELSGAAPGCAFFLLLPPDLEARQWDRLSPPALSRNTLLGVDCRGRDWTERVRQLRERRTPYLICRAYATREDADDIVSGHWAERILPWAGMAALLVPAGEIDPADAASVYTYALETRLEQRYPTLMLDFYRDDLYTTACISGAPCFLGILPDGTVTEYRRGRERPAEGSAGTEPLEQLLRRFPKPEAALDRG